MITIETARERILEHVRRLGVEEVPVEAALGRTLAAAVRAAGPVPPFAASAMDGYAVRAAPAGTELTLVGEARAGTPASAAVADGTAVRISTGAAIPDGTEAVARQEDVAERDGSLVLRADLAPGANIRGAGEDMAAGTAVITAGTVIGPAELGVAVAAGRGTLEVTRRPRVRILCTGDELRPAGAPLGRGEIHNSNGPMLTGLATQAGAQASPATVVPDEPDRTEQALADALASAEVVLVSGGVSVGPHDHVKPALERLGVEEVFWRVALQPGKPTWFGRREDTFVLGLPGNPVSAAVTFALFARPLIHALLGAEPAPRIAYGRLTTAIRASPDRQQAIRVGIIPRTDGLPEVTPTGAQGSHRTTSLLGADALALIPAATGELAAGDVVRLELLPR